MKNAEKVKNNDNSKAKVSSKLSINSKGEYSLDLSDINTRRNVMKRINSFKGFDVSE